MLTSVFGISIKYEAWNHQDSLPVYIAGSYDFHTAYIGNRRCIMLAPTEELATLPALKIPYAVFLFQIFQFLTYQFEVIQEFLLSRFIF